MALVTERLILRPWQASDAEELFRYASNPEVGPIAGWPVHISVTNSRDIIQGVLSTPETYAIVQKETRLPIGSISLKMGEATDLTDSADECELGYWLGVPYWGRGIVPEAAKELIRYGFEELGMRKIWCAYYDGNNKSKRVQEKCGFIFHHTTDQVEVPLMGEQRRGHVNCMRKEDWVKKYEQI